MVSYIIFCAILFLLDIKKKYKTFEKHKGRDLVVLTILILSVQFDNQQALGGRTGHAQG